MELIRETKAALVSIPIPNIWKYWHRVGINGIESGRKKYLSKWLKFNPNLLLLLQIISHIPIPSFCSSYCSFPK